MKVATKTASGGEDTKKIEDICPNSVKNIEFSNPKVTL